MNQPLSEVITGLFADDLDGTPIFVPEALPELKYRELLAIYKAIEEARNTIARTIADQAVLG